MDLELSDAVAFVSGSSRGIGKAIAARLLQEGANVIITGRNAESLRQTQIEFSERFEEHRVLALECDHTSEEAARNAVQKAIDRWGKIDILVANVGTGRSVPGWDLDADTWNKAFEENFSATIHVTRAVLPGMVQRQAGSVVYIGSIVGIEATPAPLAYSAAKSALMNYAKNLSRQVGPHQVRVNYIAPGNIIFPGGSWEKHMQDRPEQVRQMIQTEVPLQRFGTPEEIADLAAFLSSPRASFITGSIVVADGGQTRSF